PDALTPMLRALLARDGAPAEPIAVDRPGQAALTTSLTSGRIEACALVLIAGRAGTRRLPGDRRSAICPWPASALTTCCGCCVRSGSGYAEPFMAHSHAALAEKEQAMIAD